MLFDLIRLCLITEMDIIRCVKWMKGWLKAYQLNSLCEEG